jgi:hypothetical protein
MSLTIGRWLVVICAIAVAQRQVVAETGLPENPYAVDRNRACGPMCITFIDSYIVDNRSYQSICKACPPGPLGTSLNDIETALAGMGYYTKVVQVDLESLKQISHPSILYSRKTNNSDMGHFVVCIGWDARRQVFDVFDPPATMAYVPESRMKDVFSGLALVTSRSPIDEDFGDTTTESRWSKWLGWEICGLGSLLIIVGIRRTIGKNARQRSAAVATSITAVLFSFVAGCSTKADTKVSDESKHGVESVSVNTQQPSITEIERRTSESMIDFGTITQGVDLKAIFELTNKSERPFRITKIDRSCSCQVIDVDPKFEIQPNGSIPIRIVVPTKGADGVFEKSFTVQTDLPTTEKISTQVLTIKANILAPVKSIPSQIMLGALPSNSGASRSIRIVTNPVALSSKFLRAMPSSNTIQITRQTKNSGMLTFDIEISKAIPIGNIDENIIFHFDDVRFPQFVVPVTGRVTGAYSVLPSEVSAHLLAMNGSMRFRVGNIHGKLFRITSIKTPDGLSANWDANAASASQHIISLTSASNIKLSGSVVIGTDDTEATAISIPIKNAEDK